MTTDNNTVAKQRAVVAACMVLFALLLFGVVWKATAAGGPPPDPGAQPTTTTTAGFVCASEVHYFAYDTDGNRFGPASAFETVQTQRDEMHRRRCQDPALLCAHIAYWNGVGLDPQSLASCVQNFLNNRTAWTDALALLELGESTCKASIDTMDDSYNTLYMVKSTDVNVAPGIFQTSPDRPSFSVLRFDCDTANAAGSKQFNYKLDCGFQPVDKNFPGVPGPPAPAPPCTNCAPPPTVPPCKNCTPTTVPPTTPPTTGCPPGYNCKDPSKGINNDPAACNLGDCGPRPVNPTPPPPDPVQPEATVKPPASVPPPPVTVVTQPTVTVTVVTPSTAPG